MIGKDRIITDLNVARMKVMRAKTCILANNLRGSRESIRVAIRYLEEAFWEMDKPSSPLD